MARQTAADELTTPGPVGEGPQPATAPGYRIIGLDEHVTSVYVPATQRTYTLAEITPDQAAQLVALKWPHIENA